MKKTNEDDYIIFASQYSFKKLLKEKYNLTISKLPDEAYIIKNNDDKPVLKILEKKAQYVEGSVIEKLWAGPAIKRMYELRLSSTFNIDYGYCVSSFLQKKLCSLKNEFVDLNTIFKEHNIQVLYGDEPDYFINLHKWIKLEYK